MNALDRLARPMTKYEEQRSTRKMRWWHESLADHMIAFPQKTQKEIAEFFQKTPATIGLILGSDAFNAYYRKRRAAHAANHDTAVRAGMYDLAEKSIGHMLTVLDKKKDTLPIDTLLRINETALKSLGYGQDAKNGPSVVVNNNAQPMQVVPVAVSIEDLELARAALRRSQEAQLAPPVLQIEHDDDEARLAGGAQAPGED